MACGQQDLLFMKVINRILTGSRLASLGPGALINVGHAQQRGCGAGKVGQARCDGMVDRCQEKKVLPWIAVNLQQAKNTTLRRHAAIEP
jgi:hypothetical protein